MSIGKGLAISSMWAALAAISIFGAHGMVVYLIACLVFFSTCALA